MKIAICIFGMICCYYLMCWSIWQLIGEDWEKYCTKEKEKKNGTS